jgi:hypothetical protein
MYVRVNERIIFSVSSVYFIQRLIGVKLTVATLLSARRWSINEE